MGTRKQVTMTVAQLTTIIFAILYLYEAISNIRLKRMIRELLEGDSNDR